MSAKQNLLFGILALQNNFISRAQLLAGFNAWVEDKRKSLADLLLEQKALSEAQHALLVALTAEHLRQHGDDARDTELNRDVALKQIQSQHADHEEGPQLPWPVPDHAGRPRVASSSQGDAMIRNAFLIALVYLGVGNVGQAAARAQEQTAVFHAPAVRQVAFAAEEIRRALEKKGKRWALRNLADLAAAPQNIRIVMVASAEDLARYVKDLSLVPPKAKGAQTYALRKRTEGARTTYVVLAADPVGAMYGGLDLAEAIHLGTLAELEDCDRSPFILRRGIKFNIPLDARTPSYSDAGDAAQHNIPEMWSKDFWREFLDEMARQRFNVLTLWNLHPFPSMVRVPEYPDVTLADVMRTRVKFDSTYSLSGKDMVRKEHLANLETLK